MKNASTRKVMIIRAYSKDIFERLLAEATELVGNEETARSMLEAGLLRLRWPRCGAYARSTGKPCRAPGNGRDGRCELHGGKSIGPRTKEGIQRRRDTAKTRARSS
jgi:hypothetical protein